MVLSLYSWALYTAGKALSYHFSKIRSLSTVTEKYACEKKEINNLTIHVEEMVLSFISLFEVCLLL